MFIKKKLKYFTRPKQISPDLSGDFRIVCFLHPKYSRTEFSHKTSQLSHVKVISFMLEEYVN